MCLGRSYFDMIKRCVLLWLKCKLSVHITHVPKSVSFADELQLPNKEIKSVDFSVYRSNCKSLYICLLLKISGEITNAMSLLIVTRCYSISGSGQKFHFREDIFMPTRSGEVYQGIFSPNQCSKAYIY